MAAGAIAVLLARLYLVASPFFVNDDLLHKIGPVGVSLTMGLPPLLLTLGLAGIVWGLWSHERWLRVERTNRRAPRCSSRRLSEALAAAGVKSSIRAAADRLPDWAVRTKISRSRSAIIFKYFLKGIPLNDAFSNGKGQR